MKKFTALFLVFALILPCGVLTASATDPVSVKLLAPPTGSVTVQKNILPDGDYSADGAPDGVYVNSGSIAIDGTEAKGGDFTISDADGNEVANVSVAPYLYYEDFEDGVSGENVNTTLLPKLSDDADDKSMFADEATALIGEEANGNKYAEGDGFAAPYKIAKIPLDGIGADSYDNKLVIKAKILRRNGDGTAAYPGIQLYNSVGVTLLNFRFLASTTTCRVFTKYSADGASLSGNGAEIGRINTGSWIDVSFELDLKAGTYNANIGGITLTGYKMYNAPTDVQLGYLQLGVRIDNILIYSGENASVTLEGSTPEYVTTSETKNTMVPFDVIMQPFGTAPEWESDNQGVSVEDGYLCVQPQTSVADVTLTASGHGVEKDYEVTVSSALEEDFEDETIGGDIKADGENQYFDGNGDWDVLISKRAVLNAKVKGNGTVTLESDNGNIAIAVQADNDKWSTFDVFADLESGSYIAALNKKIIGEGTLETEKITGLATTGVLIDDIYLGSTYDSAPEVLDVCADGVVMGGETVVADYRYFSTLDEEMDSVSYAWYIADNEGETGSLVSTEESFKLLTGHIGKYLYLEVTATSVMGDSTTSCSEYVEVSDMFAVETVSGGIKFNINNITGETLMYPFAVLYTNGEINDVYAMGLSTVSGEVSCTLPISASYDGARVFILDGELNPLSVAKNIGTVPALYNVAAGEGFGEKDGVITLNTEPVQPAALFIFKPKTAGSFEYAYSPRNMTVNISEAGNSVKDYVAFADVTETNVSFNHSLTAEGYYEVYAKLKDKTEKKAGFGIALDKLFVSETLKNSNEDTFVNIFSNLTELGAEKLREMHKVYKVLNDKEAIGGFLAAESYNMELLETVIYLSAFVENPEYKEKLIALLNSMDFDTTPVTLMAQNSDFAATAAALAEPCAIETYLSDMKEKAILLGIKNAVNYLEAKNYIEAACGKSVKDTIAKAYRGKKFESVADVVEAVLNYKSEPSGGSGGSGGGGGSNDSGSSAGPGGPGGGDVTVASKPKNPESQKHTFTDVSGSYWANESIIYLADKGILKGYEDGSFLPEKNVTRAEFVKMICETFGISGNGSEFRDVSNADWYYSYVNAASGVGIINGSDGLFRPNDTITRQDATLILFRAASACGMEFSGDSVALSDHSRISEYAREAVSQLCAAGIITGYPDGSFMPSNSLTRAQAAAILTRLIKN